MDTKSTTAVWLTLAGIIWLVLWLIFINPVTASPVLLIVPFILITLLLYRLLRWLARLLSVKPESIASRRRKTSCWLISIIIGLFLLLSSLHQLDWRDISVLLAIFIIGIVYIVKLLPAKA